MGKLKDGVNSINLLLNSRQAVYFLKLRIFLVFFMPLLFYSCEDTNLLVLTEAGLDAVTAVTLSDKDVQNIAVQAAQQSDSSNRIAPPGATYAKRLDRLIAQHQIHEGITFNFKVYLTKEVNAFAMADGSIRIYSGLMDIMNDEELLFIIGHEIGHVIKKHSRKKVVLAYASSAIRKGLASQENEIGQIARSTIGALTEKLANAQFSQHEERQADDYGANFLLKLGYTKEPAISALEKLDRLAKQHTFLSSHPDPASRSKRLSKRDNFTDKGEDESLLAAIWNFLKRLVVGLITLISSWFN